MRNNDRRVIWLIAAACLVPLAAAILVYRGGTVPRQMNHGELLATRQLSDTVLAEPDGTRHGTASLRGKWLLITIQPPGCDEACRSKLYLLRQVRAAQGQHMGRVTRLWLLQGEGAPSTQLTSEYPGLLIARPADPAWLSQFPAKQELTAHVYLVDPLGNLVLRYDEGLDPQGLINDLARVLKVSQIG